MARKLKISRMDPMETYDAGSLALQIMDHKKKAESLEIDAKSFQEAAQVQRDKADELEALLVRVRARDKSREAGG